MSGPAISSAKSNRTGGGGGTPHLYFLSPSIAFSSERVLNLDADLVVRAAAVHHDGGAGVGVGSRCNNKVRTSKLIYVWHYPVMHEYDRSCVTLKHIVPSPQ